MMQKVDYNDDDWLTMREVAALLGVHYGTVQVWVKHGRVPAYRDPTGHILIRYGDVKPKPIEVN